MVPLTPELRATLEMQNACVRIGAGLGLFIFARIA